MGVSPFIYGPVAVLGLLALLASLGLGSVTGSYGNIEFSSGTEQAIFYDQGGHAKVYANTTSISENGRLVNLPHLSKYLFWSNSSGTYPLYLDNSGSNQATVEDFNRFKSSDGGFNLSLSTSLGLAAIIAGIAAVGVIASVKIFGFGLSDVGINTLMKSAAYILIWAVFSSLAMSLIVSSGDFFTPIIYLALTGAYTFGVLGDLGTPSSG